MRSDLIPPLGGVAFLAAVLLAACATPTPLSAPGTETDGGYARYARSVREQIRKYWAYPCLPLAEGHCEYRSAELLVEFELLESGALHVVKVVRSSGIALYDSYAVNAVRLAAPYPPVPASVMARRKPAADPLTAAGLRATAPPPAIRISARFTYVVEGGQVE